MLICLVPAVLAAAPPIKPSHASVKTWGAANGLPEESIFGIAETSDGQIWLATRDGLTRFDGQTFHGLQPTTQNNSFGTVVSIQDSLWIGARDFVAVSQSDKFASYINPRFKIQPFPHEAKDIYGIISLQSKANGDLWLHRGEGVYSCGRDGSAPPKLAYSPPAGERISAFHQGYDGRIWISTQSGVKTWSRLGSGPIPLRGRKGYLLPNPSRKRSPILHFV